MRSALIRFALGLLPLLLLAPLADWLLWKHNAARGTGYGEVTVSRVVVAPLKGGREEYYANGTTPQRCTRSIAPHDGLDACWWLERHRVLYDR